ncbi:YdeI/OmpD-associated family protein [Flavihumibacter petaseus]|uniref:DUF1905 domain-containing protein n=1 Tax=Flavihumibacter petaseus NBRC 106054 TaxID=1220578 RepID=A0A0E9MYZ1_9BACT|nr:YdeI/OmpD-associated family protein [Flavihumibacter petaseus]GAO42621.1 hypothetical protein FPE01S_01_16360 [Flavihumibacter petaseus NBRC 106054]
MAIKKKKPDFVINGDFLLRRMAGKGGWTYAAIPDPLPKGDRPFGYKRVSGTVDGHTVTGCSLMPMQGGGLFLPVNASLRKAIGKKAGDTVRIALYPDEAPIGLPEDFAACLEDAPGALEIFRSFTHSQQKYFLVWIDGARREETRVNRIAKSISKILRGETLYDQWGRI